MNKKKLEQSVYKHAPTLISEQGYISPVELFVKMGRLRHKQVKDWRFRQIPYLESVIVGQFTKQTYILEMLKKFATEHNLKPSITIYKSWGKGPGELLQFSRKGSRFIEELYSTHYVKGRK
ncbi:hypothetical protein SAMN04487944_11812 [Gracilibacillus ureilyticus]|uniref:Uncharacterized protein n=1 Tax=Gracilibacillus ureilyticus TaxID=531814 RepID=A0A1H9UK13_9BACI|nr:hypothetical protein [Gracilibacillus ureilyticus]SES09880.1 hypothetical protein SAMN04487944_11812 [Gracilibacillus ureilyticus]